MLKSLKIMALSLCVMAFAPNAFAASVYTEELTWKEIRSLVDGGKKIAIVPIGSTEQHGPHMVTGSHNTIVHYAAGEIAKRLKNALVAPTIPLAPAGRIYPPEGHMQFAGTVSVSDKTMAAVLEDVARSLKQHGFKLICFIGDHGGSQRAQKEVAEKLTDDWFSEGVIVLNVSDYYANNGQEGWGNKTGLKVADPAAHGGHIGTSELLALDPKGVRATLRANRSERDYRATGAMGDSTQATANYGRKYVGLKIQAAVDQIRHVDSPVQ